MEAMVSKPQPVENDDVPSLLGADHMIAFFCKFAGRDAGMKLINASTKLRKPMGELSLALCKLHKRQGEEALSSFFNRRGRRPLRDLLVRLLRKEVKASKIKQEANEAINVFMPAEGNVTMDLFVKHISAPLASDYEDSRGPIARAAIGAAQHISDNKLPVPEATVKALNERGVLGRNLALTALSSLSEVLWDCCGPLSLQVLDATISESLMLVYLAFLAKFEATVSVKAIVGAVETLCKEISQL